MHNGHPVNSLAEKNLLSVYVSHHPRKEQKVMKNKLGNSTKDTGACYLFPFSFFLYGLEMAQEGRPLQVGLEICLQRVRELVLKLLLGSCPMLAILTLFL